MLENLLSNAGNYVHTNPWLALGAVFVGGVLSAASPCVLAMIPMMIGYVAGRQDDRPSPLRAFSLSMIFVVGLSISFVVLGMGAALAGTIYGEVSAVWNWIVAAVCLVMGFHMMGLFKVPIPSLAGRFQPKHRGRVGALVLGLLFGLVSAPCAAPILVVLLTYLAGTGASLAWGALLLLTYALGHSVLILVAGTSAGLARGLFENRRMARITATLRIGAGLTIVAVGLYFGYRGIA